MTILLLFAFLFMGGIGIAFRAAGFAIKVAILFLVVSIVCNSGGLHL